MSKIFLYGKITSYKIDKFNNTLNIYLKDILDAERFYYNNLITLLLIRKWRKTNKYKQFSSKKFNTEILFFDAAITRKGDYQIMEFQIEYKTSAETAIELFNHMLVEFTIELKESDILLEINNMKALINAKQDYLPVWALSKLFSLMYQNDKFIIAEYEEVFNLDGISYESILNYYTKKYLYLPVFILGIDDVKHEDIKITSYKNSTIEKKEQKHFVFCNNSSTKAYIIVIGLKCDCTMDSVLYWEMKVLNTLLAGENDAILTTKLRDDLNISYEAYSLYDEIKGFLAIRIICQKQYVDLIENQVYQTFTQIKEGNYMHSRLEHAKSILINSYMNMDNMQLADFYLKQHLMGIDISIEKAIKRISDVSESSISNAIELLNLHTIVIATGKKED